MVLFWSANILIWFSSCFLKMKLELICARAHLFCAFSYFLEKTVLKLMVIQFRTHEFHIKILKGLHMTSCIDQLVERKHKKFTIISTQRTLQLKHKYVRVIYIIFTFVPKYLCLYIQVRFFTQLLPFCGYVSYSWFINIDIYLL